MRVQAQQITYTVLRLAPYIRRPELRSRLEEVALNCFVAAGLGNATEVERHAEALLGLVQLGKSLYEVELINGDMLIGALKDLAAIARMPEVKKAAEDKPDVAELLNEGARLFSIKKPVIEDAPSVSFAERSATFGNLDRQLPNVRQFGNEVVAERSATINPNPPQIEALPNDRQLSGQDELPIEPDDADQEIIEEESGSMSGMVSIGSAIRQSAIIDKIRSMTIRGSDGELVGCRMKDLTAIFPEVSERTLRNDIQRLVNQGKIERHGAGGFSVYVIK